MKSLEPCHPTISSTDRYTGRCIHLLDCPLSGSGAYRYLYSHHTDKDTDSIMELFTYAGNFRAFKALIAAEYAGIEITVPAFSLGKDNNTKEFKQMSPLGKLPVLKTPQGALFEVIIWTSVLFLHFFARVFHGYFCSTARLNNFPL